MRGNKKKVYRHFVSDSPIHVYTKGVNGGILFYTLEDYLCYFSRYMCDAYKYGIKVVGVTMMPNHVHSSEQSSAEESFIRFHQETEAAFALDSNKRRSRSGPVFKHRFGYAPKTTAKTIRDSFCYQANNPVVGRLSRTVLEYRWNFLAYYQSDHPFSEKIMLKKASRRVRRACCIIDSASRKWEPLSLTTCRI